MLTLRRNQLIFLAAAGSAALMLGALGFQYIGQMPPCKLCYWQRYPHIAAIVIGGLALMISGRFLPALGALAALATGAIGVYHTGVERAWWEGPSTCTSSGAAGKTASELFDEIMAAPLIRCDEVPWEMFGLSMASWNAVIAFGLAALWVMAARSAD